MEKCAIEAKITDWSISQVTLEDLFQTIVKESNTLLSPHRINLKNSLDEPNLLLIN